MEGLHSIDLAIILAPALYEFISTIADSVGIEYKTGLDVEEEDEVLDDTLMAKAKDTSQIDKLVRKVQTEENSRVEQALSGLMTRETEAIEEEMPI